MSDTDVAAMCQHCFAKPEVDVPPACGRDCTRVDAEFFDRINQGKNAPDLAPAAHGKQKLCARTDIGHIRERVPGTDGLQDVYSRKNSALMVRSPADNGKGLAWCITLNAAPLSIDAGGDGFAKTQPVLARPMVPIELDLAEVGAFRARRP